MHNSQPKTFGGKEQNQRLPATETARCLGLCALESQLFEHDVEEVQWQDREPCNLQLARCECVSWAQHKKAARCVMKAYVSHLPGFSGHCSKLPIALEMP